MYIHIIESCVNTIKGMFEISIKLLTVPLNYAG